MTDQQNFEAWRDELPNQRYGAAVQEAWYAGIASREKGDQYWDAESAARQMDKLTAELGNKQKEINAAYFQGMVAGSEMKSDIDSLIDILPVNPIEVYSPHTEVLK